MEPARSVLPVSPGRILVVDDDEDACALIRAALGRAGHEVLLAHTSDQAFAQLDQHELDAALADVNLAGASGIDLCRRMVERRPDLPVIVVTAYGNLDVAVGAIRAGAHDFVAKPFNVDALTLAVERAVQHRRLRGEVRRLRDQISERQPAFPGASAEIGRISTLIAQVATTDATVLITGESGTGKELVARAIHERSARARAPFVAVNCAAVPAGLIESELFGHVKGAFTDARKGRPGLLVQASGGTLFLDEIGELPLEMQPKLLRALQERKVRPVGADEEISFDARIVAATNRDLELEVDEGRFRADLYYRVNVVLIEVPPLRARRADILPLAQHFLQRLAERAAKPVIGLSAPAARKLLDYDWPGNVRELENCVERAVALGRHSEIVVDDLPDKVREHRAANLVIEAENPDEMVTLEELERRYVARVLQACGGNKSRAARVLGLDRRSLYRRIESLGLEATSRRES